MRYASVRFEGALTESERTAAGQAVELTGARVASWNRGAGRTYATLALGGATLDGLRAALAPAEVDEPPVLVVAVRPAAPAALGRLERALAGNGRPAGIRFARCDDGRLILELDEARTSLGFVLDAIDAVLGLQSGREIVPLSPLGDATLAALAARVLQAPQIDAERVLERHAAQVAKP